MWNRHKWKWISFLVFTAEYSVLVTITNRTDIYFDIFYPLYRDHSELWKDKYDLITQFGFSSECKLENDISFVSMRSNLIEHLVSVYNFQFLMSSLRSSNFNWYFQKSLLIRIEMIGSIWNHFDWELKIIVQFETESKSLAFDSKQSFDYRLFVRFFWCMCQ